MSVIDKRNALELADFIEEVIEYLPESDRAPYEALANELAEQKNVTLELALEKVTNLAVATWPSRRATRRFCEGAGAGVEWDEIMAAVRPTTRVMLERLKKNTGLDTLDQVLASSDAPLAIHQDEETEIALLRPEVRAMIWLAHQAKLEPQVKAAQAELESMKKRIKLLRDTAARSSSTQSVVLEKLERYEDKIYFEGEAVPLDVLDAELKYASEDVELPPTDDVLNGAENLPVKFEVEGGEEAAETPAEEGEGAPKKKRGRPKKEE
jgi:hypothetical protein